MQAQYRSCQRSGGLCYLGDRILVSENAEKEVGGGLSLAVCDGTVAVHDQVLLNPGRQVLLPAGLWGRHTRSRHCQATHTDTGLCPGVVLTRQQ